MRLLITILALAVLAACSTPGRRGADCAATSTANAKEGNAAAAAATGGQNASQAPFAGETGWRADASNTIGNGAGSTTSSRDGNSERRTVSSGGAQNIGLLNPATSSADASSGGVSLAVQEASKNVAAARRAYQVAVMDPATSDARLTFLADEIVRAQEMLNAASASSRANITHNYNMTGDNTLVGYSRAGNGEGADSPEAMDAMKSAANATFARKAAMETAPAAPEAPASVPSGSGGSR